MRLPNAGIEQPEEIVDFGRGTHRGAGIAGGGLLLNGDHRTQSIDTIHRRPLQLAHELTGISRKRFQVPALSFGIQGRKGQRGFAAPAGPGDHHQ